MTKEERLQKFSHPTDIDGFFAFKGDPVEAGESDFYRRIDDKIYFSFPLALNGHAALVAGADSASFKTLAQHLQWGKLSEADHLRRRNIGVDKNHVYCGVEKIPDLSPDTLVYLGDGYLTDNNDTYFCDWQFQAESDQIEPNFLEKIDYALFGTSIAQAGFYYPVYQLLNGKNPYRLVLTNTVTNGESSYVNGLYLKTAAPQNLRYLTTFKPEEKIWPQDSYTTDNTHVFFKEKVLDVRYNAQLESIPFNFKIYLYDPVDGNYFYESHKIGHKNIKLIYSDANFSFHPVFSDGENLIFFNTKTLQVESLNKNPFKVLPHRLSSGVFSNGENIYFFRKNKVFSSTLIMSFSETCLQISEIQVLYDMPFSGWKKLGTLLVKHPEYAGLQLKGSFWQYKNTLYYLPEENSNTSMFKVNSTDEVDKLRQQQLGYAQAEALLNNRLVFEAVEGERFSKIKDVQRFCFKNFIH